MAISLPRVQTSGFHTEVNFKLVFHFKFKLILRVIWTLQQQLFYLEELKCILQLLAPGSFIACPLGFYHWGCNIEGQTEKDRSILLNLT